MMPILLFVLVLSLLLERFLKIYGPSSNVWLAANSLAIVGSALYIIVSHRYAQGEASWAYVCVGIAVGLWLKNARHSSSEARPN